MMIWNKITDFIFPKLCFNCQKRILKGDLLCTECEDSLTFLTEICDHCGSYKDPKNCPTCQNSDFVFDKARSMYRFDHLIQTMIHEYKYNEITKFAHFFSLKAQQYFLEFQPFPKIDIIAPVPLHRVKKRARGFNQAELLTREIAKRMDFEHIPDLIKRKKFTKTQTKLSKKQRMENVASAFQVNSRYQVKGKSILIVDDVFTTGSTANSICRVVKEEKADSVFVFTIARA